MATNTPKLTLPKPDANDNFNRAAYNALIDAIDTNVGTKTQAADAHIADNTKHITPADKAKWDAGQLFKLTSDDGTPKQTGVTNADLITESGEYYTAANCIGMPDNEFYKITSQKINAGASTQYAVKIVSNQLFSRIRSSSIWQPWRKVTDTNLLGNVLLGNKFVDQSNANFVGKVSGSTTANPHIFGRASSTTLTTPGVYAEQVQLSYDQVSKLDATTTSYTLSTNGQIAQMLFSFNLISHVQSTYGTIPGATTADKVAWLKSNLSKLTFNWFGFGSSVGGNKATLQRWNTSTSQWYGGGSHTLSTITRLQTGSSVASMPTDIDSNGFVHYLAYADASDGTIASVINTDYVELQIELSTDIKTNIPNATPSTAGLQSAADKTKLDGISAAANRVTNPAINGSIAIDGVNAVVYAHPTGDGNSHVPATGTTNNGKVLKSGATANALSWAFVDWSEILNKPSTFLPSAHTHAITDVTGLSAALTNKIETSQRGAVNGVASLGADGKVPTAQLPTISNAAADITVADTSNYFASASVEGSLAEVGQVLAGTRQSIVTTAQQLGVM